MEAVVVSETQVGLGLFATKSFAPNELVGHVSGEVVAEEDYCSNYCIDLSNGTGLEPEAPFRYLNHSCTPNCELFLADEACPTTGEGRVVVSVETTRAILVGEELTIDYGWPAEHAIRCLCGSSQCRGWIVAAEELSLVEQQQTAV
jgi:uncharacterized protein